MLNANDAISLLANFEPANIAEALKDPHWRKSAKDEFQSMESNRVFSLIPPVENRKPIKLIWVFKNKLNQQGDVVRNKSRLCAQGFTQIAGLDYDQTFASVVRYTTTRLFLAISCQLRNHIVSQCRSR
ncbi:uncharacterized protein LOC129617699 [Condylostylus longicornis]|uniref:uncharacterized protein LOC129617699 n=1 Tax=Condylostylus longicornis TaxID=2530218 RepID=UPI00244DBD95|nr:uncharacterized protein LOC129617699 [Condylostylus longicornis]